MPEKRTASRKEKEPSSRLNVRAESRRLWNSPLDPLWRRLAPKNRSPWFWGDELGRSIQAYEYYALSVQRFYEELSLAARWRNGPYYAWKYRAAYTPYERKLTQRYRAVAHYVELDFFNCLLHARILMDRTIALSRRFLPQVGASPSFNSFSDHKRFFQRHAQWHSDFEDYALYIRTQTEWFDALKEIRDRALVHQGPAHSRFFGHPFRRTDLELVVHYPNDNKLPLGPGQPSVFSIRILSANIEDFLGWFTRRGLRALRDGGKKLRKNPSG